LPAADKARFLQIVVPAAEKYHLWLYRERHPDNDGLIALVHPWESGLDNSPYWMHPLEVLSADSTIVNWLRSDFEFVTAEQREKPDDAIRILLQAYWLQKNHHDSAEALRHSPILVGDLAFNAILVAANQSLERLAATAGYELSSELKADARKTPDAIERLFDKNTGQYYSYDFRQKELIKYPTIISFTAWLAGCQQADTLLPLLNDPKNYQLPYPIPSVPKTSPDFDEQRYWQGPVWINMNWLTVKGLRQSGHPKTAERIRRATLELVEKSGCREYFSPLDGRGLGGKDFSWTAALYLDLLESSYGL
jgi:hypothetical protein